MDILNVITAPFYYLGIGIWNMMLSLIGATMHNSPETFSVGTWNFVTIFLYPLFAGIGASLLNIFFFIGFIRQASNLKQNFTLEIFVECCIKVVFGNALLQSGIYFMSFLFSIAGDITGSLMAGLDAPFVQENLDGGAMFFYATFGIFFFIICLVSSFTIFLVVYGRFLQLYLLVLAMPVAISTLPGGTGVSQTAFSWLKTFLSKTFGIIFIALAIIIASKLCNGIDFGQLEGADATSGFIQAIQNICTMVLLAASVKGTDVFMHKAFAL